jgi:hypothetical protein
MDRSALHYMVLYQDHPDWHGVHGPTSRRSSDGELGISGRLSRLTGRLHDIGVARLAAMKQVDQLKNFAQYLSHVENQLQRYNPERPRQGSLEPLSFEAIQELRSQTFFRAEAFDESVVNRSLRASGYFESVRTLSEDLGIIGIPRWQSYELFIRRRLFRTLHEISAVSARYQAVLKVFNTIYQMQTAEETKRLARRIGASTQGARDLMDQLRGLQFDAGIVAFLLLFATAAEVLGRYTSARLFGLDLTGAKAAAPMVALAAVVAAIGFTLWTTVKKAFGKDQGQEDRT